MSYLMIYQSFSVSKIIILNFGFSVKITSGCLRQKEWRKLSEWSVSSYKNDNIVHIIDQIDQSKVKWVVLWNMENHLKLQLYDPFYWNKDFLVISALQQVFIFWTWCECDQKRNCHFSKKAFEQLKFWK